jgi:formate/nitrite transporter FocA (FNT family)
VGAPCQKRVYSFHGTDYGSQFWSGPESGYFFSGSELFTGNNMIFAVGKLKSHVGFNVILERLPFALSATFWDLSSLRVGVTRESLSAEPQGLIVKASEMKMALSASEVFLEIFYITG